MTVDLHRVCIPKLSSFFLFSLLKMGKSEIVGFGEDVLVGDCIFNVLICHAYRLFCMCHVSIAPMKSKP